MNWIIDRKADIARGATAASPGSAIMPLAYPGDSNAHEWRVTVTNDGEPVDLTGASVTGYFYRHYDSASPFVNTTVTSGNVASVTIPAEAYAYEGYVTGVMRMVLDEDIITLDAINFSVSKDVTAAPIDPGDVVNIDAVLALIDDMEALVASSVRYDMAQSLTTAQKTQARSNIAAATVSLSGNTLVVEV